MIATHETLWLTCTSASTLSPGRVQRALRTGLRLVSDAVGLMSPQGQRRISVEIALPQALGIHTPMTFTVQEDGVRSLFTLRRESDPHDATSHLLQVTWTGPSRPSPGQLVRALAKASEDRFLAGDLGMVHEGSERLIITSSAGLHHRLSLPISVDCDGMTLTLSAIDNHDA